MIENNGWYTTKKKQIPYDLLVEGLWSIASEEEGKVRHIGFARSDCIVYKCEDGHEHCRIIAPGSESGWVSCGSAPDFWRPQQGLPNVIAL